MIKRIALLIFAAMFIISGTSHAYYKGSSSDSNKKQKSDKTDEKLAMNAAAAEKSDDTMVMSSTSELKEGYVKTSLAYPTGRKSTSTVLLEKHYPEKGVVGRAYSYMITVTNLSDLDIENVVVSEIIPDNFLVDSSEPAISSKLGTKATWKLGALTPQQTVVINISGSASDKASSPCCAQVQYDVPALCHKTVLEQPSVSLELNAPKEALSCDLIELEYIVNNTGDSTLDNLTVKSELPEGVLTSSGKNSIEFVVGPLAVGETKTVKELVQVPDQGQYRFAGSVSGEYVSSESNVKYTKAVKPNVIVDIKAKRDKQYIGREINYVIEVKNTSATDAQSTMVVAEIPDNTEFKSASDEGRQVEDIVGWELGTLKAFETKRLELALNTNGQGIAKTKVGVQASCCEPTTDTAETELVGIPALLLEVVDMADPIEVGEEETYVVKVTNQGTADANNVKIAAHFDGMDYVSSEGESMGMMDMGMLSFSPVKTIGSKESVTWKVKVKGNKEGDLRFKVSLTSDELTQSVEEAESTFVY